MFNSVGVICKPNDFTSQKTALELGVLLKDLGVNFLLDQEEFESEADLIIVVGGDGRFSYGSQITNFVSYA